MKKYFCNKFSMKKQKHIVSKYAEFQVSIYFLLRSRNFSKVVFNALVKLTTCKILLWSSNIGNIQLKL